MAEVHERDVVDDSARTVVPVFQTPELDRYKAAHIDANGCLKVVSEGSTSSGETNIPANSTVDITSSAAQFVDIWTDFTAAALEVIDGSTVIGKLDPALSYTFKSPINISGTLKVKNLSLVTAANVIVYYR